MKKFNTLGKKTMDNLQYGDILVDDNGREKKVLAVLNQGELVVLISCFDELNETGSWCTITEIKEYGYKLKDQQEPVKMTVAEVAKKLGHNVEIVEG